MAERDTSMHERDTSSSLVDVPVRAGLPETRDVNSVARIRVR